MLKNDFKNLKKGELSLKFINKNTGREIQKSSEYDILHDIIFLNV